MNLYVHYSVFHITINNKCTFTFYSPFHLTNPTCELFVEAVLLCISIWTYFIGSTLTTSSNDGHGCSTVHSETKFASKLFQRPQSFLHETSTEGTWGGGTDTEKLTALFEAHGVYVQHSGCRIWCCNGVDNEVLCLLGLLVSDTVYFCRWVTN